MRITNKHVCCLLIGMQGQYVQANGAVNPSAIQQQANDSRPAFESDPIDQADDPNADFKQRLEEEKELREDQIGAADDSEPEPDTEDETEEQGVKDDGVDEVQPLYDVDGTCQKGEDCPLHPFNICVAHQCKHKTIFPIYPREFAGIIVIPIVLALANVGGVGGGGLVIPIIMALFMFTTKEAIAISGFTILCGAVARFIMTVNQKHPEKDATVIDYGIVIVMMPLVLVGSFVGVLVNLTLPGLVLSLMLTIILVALTLQSWYKAHQIYAKETKQLIERQMRERQMNQQRVLNTASGDGAISPPGTTQGRYDKFEDEGSCEDGKEEDEGADKKERRHILSQDGDNYARNNDTLESDLNQARVTAQDQQFWTAQQQGIPNGTVQRQRDHALSIFSTSTIAAEDNPQTKVSQKEIDELEELLEDEKSHTRQWRKHVLAICIISIALLVNLIRGSKRSPSIIGIERCGELDWSIFIAYVLGSLGLSFAGVYINKREQNLKQRVGRGMVQSDIKYSGRSLFYLMFFAFIGGWVSGAFGLGGGSVFNPLMIELGVPPTVSTSTGMYMIMFSTFASSFIYISYGALDVPFAIWLGIWSVIGILLGVTIVNSLIARYNRQSLIVFILCLVLAVSAILVPIFNGMEVVHDLEQGKDIWQFGSICEDVSDRGYIGKPHRMWSL